MEHYAYYKGQVKGTNDGYIKIITVIIFFILIMQGMWGLGGCKYLRSKAVTVYEGLEVTQEPLQTGCTMDDFTEKYDEYDCKVVGRADYRITAKVQSIHHLSRFLGDWTTYLSPYDFALAWGELADSKMDKYIKYSQCGRFYLYQYSADCPVGKSYIMQHSANNHLIPANKSVLKGVKQVKKGDIIYLEGHLVDVFTTIKGQQSSWTTSTVRNDTGCEIIYLEKIVIGESVYK